MEVFPSLEEEAPLKTEVHMAGWPGSLAMLRQAEKSTVGTEAAGEPAAIVAGSAGASVSCWSLTWTTVDSAQDVSRI